MLVTVGDVQRVEMFQWATLIRKAHSGDAFQHLVQFLLARGLGGPRQRWFRANTPAPAYNTIANCTPSLGGKNHTVSRGRIEGSSETLKELGPFLMRS